MADIEWIRLYASLAGRINRSTYWAGMFAWTFVLWFVLATVDVDDGRANWRGVLVPVAAIWPVLAVHVKR